MFGQFRAWLGPFRTRILVTSLIMTGIASLALAAVAGDEDWSLAAQTFLALLFLATATIVIGSRMPQNPRQRLFFTVGPALGLAVLSILLPRQYFALGLGMAFGWLLAAQFFIRERMQPEYKQAVKHMRKQEYKEAIRTISDLIKDEPNNSEHVRFRAELHRLAGHPGAAIKDYEKVTRLDPVGPTGYNGLAEVYLQKGEYVQAREYAQKAFDLEPDYWVAPYNLGMIEDRLGESKSVVEHLTVVVQKGLPDSRHRLLTYLWLARAHYQLGDALAAEDSLRKLRREDKGLHEWQRILSDSQAATLKKILEADVRLAERAMDNSSATADDLLGDSRT